MRTKLRRRGSVFFRCFEAVPNSIGTNPWESVTMFSGTRNFLTDIVIRVNLQKKSSGILGDQMGKYFIVVSVGDPFLVLIPRKKRQIFDVTR